MKKLFFALTMAVLFTGCTFKDDPTTSVFSGGLWVLPLILFLAAGWNLYISFKKANSGAERQLPKGGYGPAENLKFWQISNFKYSVAFVIAAIGVIIWVVSER